MSSPADLPINDRRDEIIAAIRDHQVVVIAGETGSGKSTQLPQMCLAAGHGEHGVIGHTQPRRIAARSIAARIADELGVDVGRTVGYSVRFDNRTSADTTVKVMTDGILLAELARNRNLDGYSVIIVDEAHERSLNIDFLLGHLHRLRSRRPDLRIIITSATIDTEKIAAHFDDAPVIEVSGRTFPVEVRWRPDEAGDRPAAVRRAVTELTREGPGDILVFSSGEAEINELCETLRRHEPDLEVLPLYARLPSKEQQRIFRSGARRRVIVSTNVAETSLTVPGIRYVIDIGEARISRFSQRTKVQRLPIEPISQASANQRSGRCGRLGPGIAIRLYDEDDFARRPEFTEPEIQRTNLASVVLAMADQRLGSPLEFPFVDPPEPRAVADGIRLLHELRAVESPEFRTRRWLTRRGRHLARLPIDPRLGAIVLAADDEGCLHEGTIVAAALAVQDPRERPPDRRAAADEAHAEFADDHSDFLSLLHLWHAARRERRDRSRRQFARWARDRFLHAQRINEWFDTIEQLRDETERIGIDVTYSSDFDVSLGPGADDNEGEDIHRAVLAGLLSQVGMRIERSHEYLGPRNARFAIQPGSTCFESRPPFIMAATLVETSRLWARTVAPVDPAWVEEPAAHLVTVEITEPEWDRGRGRAMTTETLRLHGLPIIVDRPAPLDRHDATAARAAFIDRALVDGDWDGAVHSVLTTNESVRHEARNLVVRATARGFDDERHAVRAFYEQRLPATVTNGARFDAWYGPAAADDPHLLEMTLADLVDETELTVDEDRFPEQVEHRGVELAVDYQDVATAIAIEIPLPALASLDATSFLGVMPGHRRDAVIALTRALPKSLRKRLVPVPETIDAVIAELGDEVDPARYGLAVRHALERRLGTLLPADALDPRTLPTPLRPNYRVVSDDGAVLAEGPDPEALRARLAGDIDDALDAGAEGITHPPATDWVFGDLADTVQIRTRGGRTTARPALADHGNAVSVRLVADASEQRRGNWAGTRRLLRLTVAAPLRTLNANLDANRQLALDLTPHGDRKAWFEDVTLACLGVVVDEVGAATSRESFESIQKLARRRLPELADEWGPVAASIIDETAAIRLALAGSGRLPGDCVADARFHLERLTYPDHLSAVGVGRFGDVLRYLQGIRHRLERLPQRPGADRSAMHQAQAVEAAYDIVAENLSWTPALESIAWSLEELRVSLFAQHLGTTEKVSATRIRRRLDRLAVA